MICSDQASISPQRGPGRAYESDRGRQLGPHFMRRAPLVGCSTYRKGGATSWSFFRLRRPSGSRVAVISDMSPTIRANDPVKIKNASIVAPFLAMNM